MKVLITGVNGFIGQHICKCLLQNSSIRIIGVDISPSTEFKEIIYKLKDISSDSFVDEMVKEIITVDVIIHVAALIGYNDRDNNLFKVNCVGTNNIVNLAKQIKCKKVIYVSSIPVIGEPKILPINENHTMEPKTVYHVTKLTGEYLVSLLKNYNIEHVILRIPSPIGIGMSNNTILSVFLGRALKNENLEIYGKGLRVQNYIDVRDVAYAISLVLEKSISGIFNIASEKGISNIDLARKCLELISSQGEIAFSSSGDLNDDISWEISIEKAREQIGYYPKYTIDESIKWIINNLT